MNQNDMLSVAVSVWILIIGLIVLLVVRHRQKPQRIHWLKPSRVIAPVCVLLLCGTALYIYNNSQAQKAQPQQPPDTDKIVKSDPLGIETPPPAQAPRVTFSLDEALTPKDEPNANGTPAGAWAATLVPVPTENNLFRDPVTRKLYRVQNGAIVLETNPYAGLQPQTGLVSAQIYAPRFTPRLSVFSIEQQQQQNQDDILREMRRANDLTEQAHSDYLYNQSMQSFEQSQQNQQAIDEIRRIRLDNELNSIYHRP